MTDNEDIKTKTERREQKKTRRQFQIRGESLREIYLNIIVKRLRKSK